MMLVASCDSTFFRFNITVFPKDYEKFANILKENHIVMVDWNLKFNEQMNEIAIMPTGIWYKNITDIIRLTTITSLRNQAMELGTYNPDEKINYLEDEEASIEKDKKDHEEKVQKAREKKYIITPGPLVTKEKLLLLKEFMLSEPAWDIHIYLDIKWQEIDTKISLEDTATLKKFIKNNDI